MELTRTSRNAEARGKPRVLRFNIVEGHFKQTQWSRCSLDLSSAFLLASSKFCSPLLGFPFFAFFEPTEVTGLID